MNCSARLFKFVNGLFLLGVVWGCGLDGKNMVTTEVQNHKSQRGESETSLGLKAMTGLLTNSKTQLDNLFSMPEHWEYYRKDPDKQALYIPENLHTAMSAFRSAHFKDSAQDCSGIMIYEENTAGSYDVFYLTAHHCLQKVNALGERLQSVGENGERQVDFTTYVLQKEVTAVNNDATDQFNSTIIGSGLFDRKTFKKSQTVQFSFSGVQRYLNADVVRIPFKSGLSLADAKTFSLPICSSVQAPADKVFSTSQTDIRLMLGFDGDNQRLVTERMNGKHNLHGIVTGKFRTQESFKEVKDFVFDSMTFGTDVSFYGYETAIGGGAQGSDSGAPVLYGKQSPSSNTLQGTDFLFRDNYDKLAAHWKVDSIDCVSGVVSRIFSRDTLGITDTQAWARTQSLKRIIDTLKKDLSAETITIIQEVSNNSDAWKKL